MKIAITGMGIVSAIGQNVKANKQSLIAEKTGIGKATLLQSRLTDTHLFGEVKISNEQLKQELNISADILISRTSLLGIKAVKEALGQVSENKNLRTGLISGTSVGGMDRTEGFFREKIKEEKTDRITDLLTHDCGDTTDKIAEYFGGFTYVNTISTACSSSANTIMMGANLIKTGKLDRVIVGGIDPLSAFTANGFNSLMILDTEWCKPFSANRKGLNLGEGAAFLILESDKVLKDNSSKVIGYVSGYANANDAYHQTASSPDGRGATMAMTNALKMAGVNPSEISYINAHGTGTNNNDESESTAINNIFGADKPPISSTKAYTGHTLGAAGAIEAVFSVLALQNNWVFPNLNFQEQIAENDWEPALKMEDRPLKHVLSNSFGFGGNNSSLILSKA
ncbi:beta-ketoacyl-[acyl-carrier-protein] synthase family protein [Owenweeksia hongkongensis]|uniref:beta-ketoacyl-[acyl-carrier-protein] synthase family protein n=1 Tax=Owenweeksia hongkongensis TaxID=253245 RepID=UPI003A94EE27